MEYKHVAVGGVTGWESSPSHEQLPQRTLRHLGVPAGDEPLCLTAEYEPFFADTAAAAAALRDELRRRGAATAAVHSAWLSRAERRGARAEECLDAVGDHEWWSKDVSWRFAASNLRVLAYSDPDYRTTTLYAWGQEARTLLDTVALDWQKLPKVEPEEP